jgi:hypothetical protein
MSAQMEVRHTADTPPCVELLGTSLVVESGTFAGHSPPEQASEKCLLPELPAE